MESGTEGGTTAAPRPASTTCSSIVLASVGENTKASTELMRFLVLGSDSGTAVLIAVLLNGLTCTGLSSR